MLVPVTPLSAAWQTAALAPVYGAAQVKRRPAVDRRQAADGRNPVLDRAGVGIAVREIDVRRAAAEDAVAAVDIERRRWLVVEAEARLDREQAAEILAITEARSG